MKPYSLQFTLTVILLVSSLVSTAQPDCITFSNQNVSIAKYNNLWLVKDGNTSLAGFKTSAEAKTALAIIKADNLNQQCFVGRPNPSFYYWLSGENAPSGTNKSIFEFKNIEASKLKIMHNNANTYWVIRYGYEPSNVMMQFRNEKEAKEALAIMLKFQFNQMLKVGSGKYQTFFFRNSSN